MKERMKISGRTPREEMVCDGKNLLKEELEHDSSYSPTLFFYDPVLRQDDREANLRVYGRKYSSLNGNYENFLTTYDNPVKIGEYLHDTKDDTYWLVYNSFNVNDVHYEGKLIQCNYLLKWQLSNGEIVERWANIVSASKYDVGENANSTLILTSNNYTILIGYCDEGFELEDKRVFIDMKPVNPTKVFKITRSDDVLYNSGVIGSILGFIADKSELDKDRDRQDLRICDYIDIEEHSSTNPSSNPDDDITNETTVLSAEIIGNSELKLGFSRTYTAIFTDNMGDSVNLEDVDFGWHVVSDFDSFIEKAVNGNKITLKVTNEDLIDCTFNLECRLNYDNSVIGKLEISIIDLV